MIWYLLYEILLYLGSPIIFLFYFFRYKGRVFSDSGQRLGFLSPGTKEQIKQSNNWLWIHAASVGEVRTVGNLAKMLREVFPGKRILLSTATSTGNELAKKENLAHLVIYLPLDFEWVMRKMLFLIKPALLVLVETELWPNFIRQAKNMKTKIILVNGRISGKSFKRYKMFSCFIREVLSGIDLFAMRENTDAERIITLGASPDKVKITGNMKYDSVAQSPASPRGEPNHPITNYQELGFKENDLIWVCGSTREGEEKIILEVYLPVLQKYPDLKLILAPRHLERIKEIENLLKQKNIPFLRKSGLTINYQLSTINCLLLDTYGELTDAYALATIVFVGGSLVKKGGHNIIEPAGLGKPVIFGPDMESFREIAERLLSARAAIQVKNSEELKIQVLNLLGSPALREKIGTAALEAVSNIKSATDKNIELIKNLL